MAGLAGIIYRKKKRVHWAKENDEIFKRQVEKMLQKISYRGRRNKEIFSILLGIWLARLAIKSIASNCLVFLFAFS
ncbi:MAG: hypothetical protein FJW63_05555 [Actinobacteria bacterium]|nr:hypothetical protein [Actinomycetota bacterium]